MATTSEMEEFLEEHRHKYEPAQHWGARKQFMINNWDRYSGNQLASLSMVWSNIEFDGAAYPVELMTRVRLMGEGVTVEDVTAPVEEHVRKAKDVSQNQSTSTPKQLLELPVKRTWNEDSSPGPNKIQKTETRQSAKERAFAGYDNRLGGQRYPHQAAARSEPSMSKSWSGAGSTGRFGSVKAPKPGNHKEIFELASNLQKITSSDASGSSALNRLHNAGLRLSLRPDVEYVEVPPVNQQPLARRDMRKSPMVNPTWICNLYMGDALLASVEAINKPNAKTAAAQKAVLILESMEFTVKSMTQRSRDGRNYTKEVVPSDSKINERKFEVNLPNKCGAPAPTGTLENFVLMEPSKPALATSILVNSAQSNHVPILFETSDHVQTVNGKSGFVCTTTINGVNIGIGIHMSRKEARHVSAENTLEKLRKTCPVLKRNHDNAQASAIKRDELASGQKPKLLKQSGPIQDTNVGHKMLKMMGWAGGALGKDGIVEPIQATEKSSREGLGYTVPVPKNSTNQIDMAAVRKILEDHVASGKRNDLIFTSELSQDERKAIHLACRRYNLKSQSYGSGGERYLVVRQKRKLSELIHEVAESGGVCGQYELVSAGRK